ncbi:hypothetical protein HK098_002425 [Nowakowskiella sp. JEL0407]|nr:hypothetical protein HK098_002425 [Nowakowskiella sp. JEL0407]
MRMIFNDHRLKQINAQFKPNNSLPLLENNKKSCLFLLSFPDNSFFLRVLSGNFDLNSLFRYLPFPDLFLSIIFLLSVHSTSTDFESRSSLLKLLSLHLPLPNTPPPNYDIKASLKSVSIFSLGLIHSLSLNLQYLQFTSLEIGRLVFPQNKDLICSPPEVTVEQGRECYNLSAGIACGFIGLSRGPELLEVNPKIVEVLEAYISGSKTSLLSNLKKINVKTNLEYATNEVGINKLFSTTPAALALGFLFMGTGHDHVARVLKCPKTRYDCENSIPELIGVQVLSWGLVKWNEIEPSDQLIFNTVMPQYLKESTSSSYILRMTYYYVLGSCCFVVGVKYAGTFNKDAYRFLERHFKDIREKLLSFKVSGYSSKLIFNTMRHCLSTISIALSLVMAGSCDIKTLNLFLSLLPKPKDAKEKSSLNKFPPPSKNSGRQINFCPSHYSTHLSIATLFLKQGEFTFKPNSTISDNITKLDYFNIASIVVSYFPIFHDIFGVQVPIPENLPADAGTNSSIFREYFGFGGGQQTPTTEPPAAPPTAEGDTPTTLAALPELSDEDKLPFSLLGFEHRYHPIYRMLSLITIEPRVLILKLNGETEMGEVEVTMKKDDAVFGEKYEFVREEDGIVTVKFKTPCLIPPVHKILTMRLLGNYYANELIRMEETEMTESNEESSSTKQWKEFVNLQKLKENKWVLPIEFKSNARGYYNYLQGSMKSAMKMNMKKSVGDETPDFFIRVLETGLSGMLLDNVKNETIYETIKKKEQAIPIAFPYHQIFASDGTALPVSTSLKPLKPTFDLQKVTTNQAPIVSTLRLFSSEIDVNNLWSSFENLALKGKGSESKETVECYYSVLNTLKTFQSGKWNNVVRETERLVETLNALLQSEECLKGADLMEPCASVADFHTLLSGGTARTKRLTPAGSVYKWVVNCVYGYFSTFYSVLCEDKTTKTNGHERDDFQDEVKKFNEIKKIYYSGDLRYKILSQENINGGSSSSSSMGGNEVKKNVLWNCYCLIFGIIEWVYVEKVNENVRALEQAHNGDVARDPRLGVDGSGDVTPRKSSRRGKLGALETPGEVEVGGTPSKKQKLSEGKYADVNEILQNVEAELLSQKKSEIVVFDFLKEGGMTEQLDFFDDFEIPELSQKPVEHPATQEHNYLQDAKYVIGDINLDFEEIYNPAVYINTNQDDQNGAIDQTTKDDKHEEDSNLDNLKSLKDPNTATTEVPEQENHDEHTKQQHKTVDFQNPIDKINSESTQPTSVDVDSPSTLSPNDEPGIKSVTLTAKVPHPPTPKPQPKNRQKPPNPSAHRHYNTFHPVCNKLLAKKWDKADRKLHLEKLAKIRPRVDNSLPKVHLHLQLKLKKLRIEEDRISQIERENNILLHKMNHIMREESHHKDYSWQQDELTYGHSLNYVSRQREQSKIQAENQAIFQRLEAKAPQYDHYKFLLERRQNVTYLQNISTYPAHFNQLRKRLDDILGFSPVPPPSDNAKQITGAAARNRKFVEKDSTTLPVIPKISSEEDASEEENEVAVAAEQGQREATQKKPQPNPKVHKKPILRETSPIEAVAPTKKSDAKKKEKKITGNANKNTSNLSEEYTESVLSLNQQVAEIQLHPKKHVSKFENAKPKPTHVNEFHGGVFKQADAGSRSTTASSLKSGQLTPLDFVEPKHDVCKVWQNLPAKEYYARRDDDQSRVLTEQEILEIKQLKESHGTKSHPELNQQANELLIKPSSYNSEYLGNLAIVKGPAEELLFAIGHSESLLEQSKIKSRQSTSGNTLKKEEYTESVMILNQQVQEISLHPKNFTSNFASAQPKPTYVNEFHGVFIEDINNHTTSDSSTPQSGHITPLEFQEPKASFDVSTLWQSVPKRSKASVYASRNNLVAETHLSDQEVSEIIELKTIYGTKSQPDLNFQADELIVKSASYNSEYLQSLKVVQGPAEELVLGLQDADELVGLETKVTVESITRKGGDVAEKIIQFETLSRSNTVKKSKVEREAAENSLIDHGIYGVCGVPGLNPNVCLMTGQTQNKPLQKEKYSGLIDYGRYGIAGTGENYPLNDELLYLQNQLTNPVVLKSKETHANGETTKGLINYGVHGYAGLPDGGYPLEGVKLSTARHNDVKETLKGLINYGVHGYAGLPDGRYPLEGVKLELSKGSHGGVMRKGQIADPSIDFGIYGYAGKVGLNQPVISGAGSMNSVDAGKKQLSPIAQPQEFAIDYGIYGYAGVVGKNQTVISGAGSSATARNAGKSMNKKEIAVKSGEKSVVDYGIYGIYGIAGQAPPYAAEAGKRTLIDHGIYGYSHYPEQDPPFSVSSNQEKSLK